MCRACVVDGFRYAIVDTGLLNMMAFALFALHETRETGVLCIWCAYGVHMVSLSCAYIVHG